MNHARNYSGRSLIAAIQSSISRMISGQRNARATFGAACGNAPSSSFKNLLGEATLTTVGLSDQIHGHSGVARKGIELHPVLAVDSVSAVPVPARR